MTDMNAISVIIPAYNEDQFLPRLLDSIALARFHLEARGATVQVIVANNASTDQTTAVARAYGATVVDVTTRGIAAARNGGALSATSPILAFVDADSILHPDTFIAVLSTMRDPACIGGATGVTVDSWSVPLRILQVLTIPIRFFGIDSGLVFCRRDDFQALNGYNQALLVGEDIDFLFRLRRQGAVSKRHLRLVSGVKTVTSTRKFDKHGHWGFLGTMAKAAILRTFAPKRFSSLVRRYWYEDR